MRGMERRAALYSFRRLAASRASAEARSPPGAPSRRLQPRAALLLGPVGFRQSALSQPAPGGRPVRPPSGAPRLPILRLRDAAAGAASPLRYQDASRQRPQMS